MGRITKCWKKVADEGGFVELSQPEKKRKRSSLWKEGGAR